MELLVPSERQNQKNETSNFQHPKYPNQTTTKVNDRN